MLRRIPSTIAAAFFALLLTISPSPAQTTAPSPADDPPAPAGMAPSYISVGQQLRLRLALVRRTLADLSLDPSTRRRANQIVDAADNELKQLMTQIRSGQMPGYHRIMSIPDTLRAARDSLFALIGPDQSDLLQQKLRSLRGEARNQLDWLRQQLADLNLSESTKSECDKICTETESAVEKLPDIDLNGDDYARARATMTQLFARAHDQLAKILTSAQQSALGQHFTELAAPPTSQPAQ
jgi:hypothetical protein